MEKIRALEFVLTGNPVSDRNGAEYIVQKRSSNFIVNRMKNNIYEILKL